MVYIRDFDSDYCNVRVRICKRHHIYMNLIYAAGQESEVFKEAIVRMFEGMGPKDLKVDVLRQNWETHKNIDVIRSAYIREFFDLGMSFLCDAGDKDHLEANSLLGMILIA
uniref:Uncharacterized protein n=1 Tax=Lactuca sativa TaxID=4236 RepID=A0A9R1XWB0_LACSA|nr:hypothetical protein LSAT_V11C200066700 [Lactuca sativa]